MWSLTTYYITVCWVTKGDINLMTKDYFFWIN